jgi:hypothetical protein
MFFTALLILLCVRHCYIEMKCTCVEPSTQYVISVRAFNDVDKGPVVYDLAYTTTTQLSMCHMHAYC